MKKAYSLRSDIVRGRKIRSVKIAAKESGLSNFVQKIEDHLSYLAFSKFVFYPILYRLNIIAVFLE